MEQLKLNMIPNGVNPVFHASQYDKGRQIRFVLDETLSGAEVTVSYRAKDGTEYGNVQTSVSGNTITDTIPEEVLTDYGIIEGEVDIDGIGSLNFFVEVEKDAYDGGGIVTQTASGAIATFETNIETAFVSLKSDINPVQSGSGTPSPQNVRPISGFSALNVTRTGANLWDEQWEQGSINSVTGLNELSSLHWRTNYIKISPATEYYIVSATAENKSLRARFYDENKNYIGYSPKSGGAYTDSSFVSPDNAYYVRFAPFASDIPNHDLSLNYPATDTKYHAYNGQTATVNFGQTVYGGQLDVTRGKLTITWVTVDLGVITWIYNSTYNLFLAYLPDAKRIESGRGLYCLCDIYKSIYDEIWSGWANFPDKGISCGCNYGTSINLVVKNTDYSDTATFKTAMNGHYLAYELATPIEITTTPENLSALSGQTNNVYSDTNGDTTVEYYIEV